MTPAHLTLGEVATIVMGQSPSGDSYNRDGRGSPLLNGPTEFGSLHPTEQQWTTSPTKHCEPGDILFCVRGATAGRINVADKAYCLGRGLAAVRGNNEQCDTGFLRRVLSAGYARFQARGVGSTFINISRDELASFEVPAVALPQQRRIAGILDKADDLRAKRRAALAELDGLAQAVFMEMFGDSDGIANRWRVRRLGDCVSEFRYGTSLKSAHTGKPALRIPNVVNGSLDISDLKCVPVPEAEFRRLRLVDGDILFVRTNGNPDFVGRCALFERQAVSDSGFSPAEFVFASYLIRARLKDDSVTAVFLREFMSSPAGRQALRSRSKTSAGQFNINTAGLASVPVPVPPLAFQRDYERRLTRVESLRRACRKSLAGLDSLVASLQHRAFRGEL